MKKTTNSFLVKREDRTTISVRGSERFKFLQGLITADIEKLHDKTVLWSAILTPQGRLIADFFILDYSSECTLINCAATKRDAILNFFKKFCLRSNVQFEPQAYITYTHWGTPSLQPQEEPIFLFTDPRLKAAGQYLITSEEMPSPTANATLHDYEAHRLALGLPDPSVDAIAGETLPAECNMDLLGGIAWDKGCYIGQEITARLYYRHRLKKRLIPFYSSTPLTKEQHAVTDGEKMVGEVRTHNGHRGLAMLKLAQLSDSLLIDTTSKLELIIPPWLQAGLQSTEEKDT